MFEKLQWNVVAQFLLRVKDLMSCASVELVFRLDKRRNRADSEL
jgi:hypothetical protein